ncbi:MAG: leucine--tRNA ligase, partial [Planctomycetaceae bacterium]|nr:leucine--tRNA ligase [Planctomycetaceae bacterium]
SIAKQAWPAWDAEALVESSIEIPVQLNGKVKAKIRVAPDVSKDDLQKAALSDPKVQALLEGKTVVKEIVVPGRLVNLVVK